MKGILTITYLTFKEARRRKILLAALLLGLAFQAIFALGFYFIFKDIEARNTLPHQKSIILNFVVMAGLYATNFLMVMSAVLAPVDTLSGEIESGAIQLLATKPVRRAEIVVGKWLGFWIILLMYVALMAGGIVLTAWVLGRFAPPNFSIGLMLMMMEATLLMTLSIAGGTRLSTLANGVAVFGLYGLSFIGGWMEQIGTLFGNTTARNLGILASLLVPSESLWQLAAYNMQPPIMRDVNLTPFSPASVPSGKMVMWAAGYIVVILMLALHQFRKRNL